MPAILPITQERRTTRCKDTKIVRLGLLSLNFFAFLPLFCPQNSSFAAKLWQKSSRPFEEERAEGYQDSLLTEPHEPLVYVACDSLLNIFKVYAKSLAIQTLISTFASQTIHRGFRSVYAGPENGCRSRFRLAYQDNETTTSPCTK